ncbi:MAG: hypothetical protein KGL64_05490 [Acidobacteriota bacterium]|nr:hypothetical protein [Acidobacteriota bacterium]
MQERKQAQRQRKIAFAASCRRNARRVVASLLLTPFVVLHSQAPPSGAPLPQAPLPQTALSTTAAPKPHALPPCPVKPATPSTASPASITEQPQQPPAQPCKPVNWFARFLNGPEVKPLTPEEKARLAVRNLLDPFNAITILGQSGIAVASDSHSPYGPGMKGFGKNVGVSYTEDMTGEFFGTFLIPSLTRQDPHYHRMPSASIRRRIAHAALQVLWTQGDNGRGMLNYASIAGSAIGLGISNLYVPGEQTHLSADLTRYSIGMATAPIDNYITEFLPDVARRIHVRIVLVQRIINQVATTEGGGTP